MNKETVNEQRNSIILYTYIQDIQLSKGSIYHIDQKNPVGHIFFLLQNNQVYGLCGNEYIYVHLSLHTSHFKVMFKHTGNIIK